jgi:hypothetical protein
MTIEADNRGFNGDTDKDGQYQCDDCGRTLQAEHLPVLESGKECPVCRQNRINETLRYIKGLLNDSGEFRNKAA